MTAEARSLLGHKLTQFTNVVRVQPVAPDPATWTDIVGEVVGQILLLAVYAWFVGLGTDVAHTYWPVVPVVAFWPAVALLLGLSAVGHAVRGPAWKWARR